MEWQTTVYKSDIVRIQCSTRTQFCERNRPTITASLVTRRNGELQNQVLLVLPILNSMSLVRAHLTPVLERLSWEETLVSGHPRRSPLRRGFRILSRPLLSKDSGVDHYDTVSRNDRGIKYANAAHIPTILAAPVSLQATRPLPVVWTLDRQR